MKGGSVEGLEVELRDQKESRVETQACHFGHLIGYSWFHCYSSVTTAFPLLGRILQTHLIPNIGE